MMTILFNHLWQSTVMVLAAALVARALHRNQARVRHAVWLAASLKFLVPFSLLIALGGAVSWRGAQTPVPAITPAVADAVQQWTEPFAGDAPPIAAAAPRTATNWGPIVLAVIWAGGFLAVVALRIRGWHRIHIAVRASTPVIIAAAGFESEIDVRSTPGLLEPGIVGIRRPILLVPAGLESVLTAEQLRAVLIHERHHIHRRDNLTSAMHMAVEAVFWFHPLVWWIGARLIDERERACDEHVLAAGAAPEAYAEGILNVCKRYAESPLACVSGVTGSDLKKRVSAILANRVGARLNLARRLAIGLAAIAALAAPVLAGAITAPLRTRVMPAVPQNAAVESQKFDVASIRPCERDTTVPGGRVGGSGPIFSPGTFVYNCGTLQQLINGAYVAYGDPLLNDESRMGGRRDGVDPKTFPDRIRGGPDWVRTERWMIEAKAPISTGLPGNQAPERSILMGPMLRALLEERFKLKIHREVQKDISMYALTVAKGGLTAKPFGPDSCTPVDLKQRPPIPMDQEIELVRKGGKPYCGHGIMGGAVGPNQGLVLNGQTMAGLALILSNMMDRHVLDQTGVDGKFEIYLEYAKDELVPNDLRDPAAPADPPTAPSITQVLKNLGLELQPTKGPKGYIVIDHAERPSFAEPVASASEGRPGISTAGLAVTQKFEVASIRPCGENLPPGARGGGSGQSASPGRMILNCQTVSGLIQAAYVIFANGVSNRPEDVLATKIEGGPDWINSERYTIEAKAEGEPTGGMMHGPMLQALLEDRFKLRVRRETREIPVYALTVANSGVKFKPHVDGSCVDPRPLDLANPTPPPALAPNQRRCAMSGRLEGPNMVVNAEGVTVQALSGVFLAGPGAGLDRPVIDRTGLSGRYDIHLEYAPSDDFRRAIAGRQGDPGDPTAPPVFTALQQQLGLKLGPARGPGAFLVIDHVEHPGGP